MLILPTQGKDFLRRCCTYFGIGGALILELTDLLAESGKDSSEIRLQACDKSRNGREARSVIFHEINDAQIHLASDLPIA